MGHGLAHLRGHTLTAAGLLLVPVDAGQRHSSPVPISRSFSSIPDHLHWCDTNIYRSSWPGSSSSYAGPPICRPDTKPLQKLPASLVALIWAGRYYHHVTPFTTATDSSVVYHTLVTGKCSTFRHNHLLQMLYCHKEWKRTCPHCPVGAVNSYLAADPLPRGVLVT